MKPLWQGFVHGAGVAALCLSLGLLVSSYGCTNPFKPKPPPAPPEPVPALSLQEQLAGATGTIVDLRWLTISPVPGGVRGLAWTPVGSNPANAQEVTLLFGSQPPQPIPPAPTPPGPVPPAPSEPTDPFFQTLKAVYIIEADADKLVQAKRLAAAYRKGAVTVTDQTFSTTGGFFAAFKKDVDGSMPTKALPYIRPALGQELSRVLPTSAAEPLTASTRQLIATHYLRMAQDLEALK